MRHQMIAVLVAAILPLAAGAQETQPPKDAPKEAAKDLPKTYLPGLEQFMNVILIEHNKLWFAGQARNWPLAAYELGEIKEVMSDVQDHIPTFKNLPLMLDAVITKEIAALEKAIDAKDFKTFAGAMISLRRHATRATRALKTASSLSSARLDQLSQIRITARGSRSGHPSPRP
jgi:hypothetical protein